MPQEYCTPRSVPQPFAQGKAGSIATPIQLVSPLTVTWDDGTVDAEWVPEGFAVTSVYDGAATIDTLNHVWLIIAVKGVTNSARLVKEKDYTSLDALLGVGTHWAAIYRILGIDIEIFQQAGSGGLPPGNKGDILRNTGPNYENYPLGQQGMVLTSDINGTGEPIWQTIAQALTPVTGTTVIVSSAAARAKSLWNGSSNNAPPSGWDTLGFNDASWGAAANAATDGQTLPAGSASIWSSGLPASTAEQCLIRHTFTLPAGTITAATLTFMRDDGTEGISINGHAVPGGIIPWASSFGPFTFSIDPTWLVAGANVLALWGDTSVPIHAWMAYNLTITSSNGGTGTSPIPGSALPDATTSTIGGVTIDQAPGSGHPVVVTVPRIGAANGVADLDSSGHVPITRLSGITHSQLDAAAGITAGQIASVNATDLQGTVPLGNLSGITHSQLDAAAGIVHGQISSVDAADLLGAGTLPVGVLPPSVPITLGTPTNGTMLVFNLGFWLMLAPAADGKVLTMVGGMPTWS